MASAVSAMSGVRSVAAAFASGSIILPVRASNVNLLPSMVSFRSVAKGISGLWATQSSVSIVGWKEVGPVRRLRVSAAEGSQTAESETVAAKPVDENAKAQDDTGKSTIDVVREVIAEQLVVEIGDLDADTKFADLGADSLDTVEIMMGLEERFDISIDEDGATSIVTVKDAADLIDQVKNK